MLQLGDSFYAGVFRSGSSVAHRLLTSHSKQGISNPGMEAKAEETLKPSEAGLREGTPTDIPLVRRTANPLQKLLRANGDCAKNVPKASELNDVSSPSVTAVTKSVLMLIFGTITVGSEQFLKWVLQSCGLMECQWEFLP